MRYIVAAAFLLSTPAGAQDSPDSTCKTFGSLAESIMVIRQHGQAMSETMEKLGQEKLVRELIVQAYEAPQMSSEEYKATLIQRFRNDAELRCYKTFKLPK